MAYTRELSRRVVPDLVELRESLGLTQREAAVLLEVAVNTWARWERGELGVHPERARQMRRLQQLVERYGQSLQWIITGDLAFMLRKLAGPISRQIPLPLGHEHEHSGG